MFTWPLSKDVRRGPQLVASLCLMLVEDVLLSEDVWFDVVFVFIMEGYSCAKCVGL